MTAPQSTAGLFARVAADVGLGLAAFAALMAMLTGGAGAAAMTQGLGASAAALAPLGVLAACFSLLVAFNLSIYRHLRRVYASWRSDEWSGGLMSHAGERLPRER